MRVDGRRKDEEETRPRSGRPRVELILFKKEIKKKRTRISVRP